VIGSHSLPMRDFLIATLNRTRLKFYEDQSNQRAGDWGPAQISSKQTYNNREDDHLGDGAACRCSESRTGRPGSGRGESPESVGLILRSNERAREFHRRISRHRDWIAKPGPAFVVDCMSLPGVETPSRKLDGKFPYSATQLLTAERNPGHIERAA